MAMLELLFLCDLSGACCGFLWWSSNVI
jgi:UDP-N-acetylmuramyl pentapeptide phosphotransferase/UDP-N-acetylglucosamine-1-phosphate transferase